jgi:hypothetical protein
MACQCRIRDEWSSDEAKRWWRAHLPQLTGPLTVKASGVRNQDSGLAKAQDLGPEALRPSSLAQP